jgi:predicted Rossmann fold flavoprotein
MNPIVIVGAGAAGLVAAIVAAGGPAPVIVIESTADGGRKILISGGGRCNILPSVLTPERFVTDSSAPVLRRLLRAWPLADQRAFFEQEVNVPLALEEETGKLFPVSNRARDVRDGLVSLAQRRGVAFEFNTKMLGLTPVATGWRVITSTGELDASRVVLATGGLSVPTTGSDGVGLDVARRLHHTVNQTYPALTPLLADPPVHSMLSGVSLDVRLRARVGRVTTESRGGFLFTHRGYSGPSVLDISHVAVRSGTDDERATVRVQWSTLDQADWETILTTGSNLVSSTLSQHVPQRLGDQLLVEAGVPLDRRLSDLRRAERLQLIDHLTSYQLPWTGDEGFKKAEVTGGGVALHEITQTTLESRRCPGLFFCGEILDAFGPIGGHNFAWAWATGRMAGLASRHL